MSAPRFYLSLAIAIVVCVVVSAGVAWAVSAATLRGHDSASVAGRASKPGAAGPQGKPGSSGPTGSAGTDGAAGLNGTNGTNGTKGSNGTNGTNGSQGIQGIQGLQGEKGDKGDPGSSAPTYSETPADSGFVLQSTLTTVATLSSTIPAGHALVGFSMQLTPQSYTSPVTCQLANQTTGDVIISAANTPTTAFTPTLFAGTELATLSVPSTLIVVCQDTVAPLQIARYSSLSIYAISFAG